VKTVGLDLTLKGQALNAKIQAGDGTVPLNITRFVTASGSSDDPWSLEDVVNFEQNAPITSRKIFGLRANISILMTNWGTPPNPETGDPGESPLTTGYVLSQIGCYAIDPDEGEILYRIMQLDPPNFMPAMNEMPVTLNPTFNITTGNASEVNITIDPSGMALAVDLNDHIDAALNSEQGVHNARFWEGRWQFMDEYGEWVEGDAGLYFERIFASGTIIGVAGTPITAYVGNVLVGERFNTIIAGNEIITIS